MKEIKDYLHLYLGCEVFVKSLKENFNWVGRNPTVINGNILILSEIGNFSFKPILRPLSDMSGEEKQDADLSRGEGDGCDNPAIPEAYEFKYLLSKHFDLFGLIEAGLAIDKSTLK